MNLGDKKYDDDDNNNCKIIILKDINDNNANNGENNKETKLTSHDKRSNNHLVDFNSNGSNSFNLTAFHCPYSSLF